MNITEEQILEALKNVEDPDLKKDLVTLNMIRNISITDKKVSFDVVLTTPACPLKDMIRNACVNAVHHFVSYEIEVVPNMTSEVTTGRDQMVLPGVRNIIAIASGKGGVGKSTVSANLARSLASFGASVGVLDADVYGPSIPKMFGLSGQKPEMEGNRIAPIVVDGIKVMSIGFLVEEKQAIVWRGPMAASAIKQFVTDVDWGDLDYLLIDLPPGTGDIHLTVVQSFPLTGSVMVTTPQEIALADCRKAINMLLNPHIDSPLLGVVENMSYFTPPELPEKKYHLFGEGGGQKLADEFGVELLGQLPIDTQIMTSGENGDNVVKNNKASSDVFGEIAGALARSIAIVNNKSAANAVSSNISE